MSDQLLRAYVWQQGVRWRVRDRITLDYEGRIVIDTTNEHHEIHLTEQGSGKPAIGHYNGLTFEISRWIIDKLEGDFVRSEKDTPAPALPGIPNGPGSPMMPNE